MKGNLYTCDLVCYGVASPGVFQEYCGALETRSGMKLVGYAHRGAGIVGDVEEIAMYGGKGCDPVASPSNVWKRIWYKYLCRESCFRCAHHSITHPGDMTIGDWWGLEDYAPKLVDPHGVSCVIVRTRRGLNLLLGASSRIELVRTEAADVANPAQPMLSHPPARGRRDVFWRAFYSRGFEGALKKIGAVGLVSRIKDLAKSNLIVLAKTKKSSGNSVDAAWKEVSVSNFKELGGRVDYPIAFAARNSNDEVRFKSSSGGVFHALASHVIEELGGVVYGCAFDEELHATHIRCETMVQAERCMGSKYSQSDMGSTIRQIREDLAKGQVVLFTGTPCQVAAVRTVCENCGGGGASNC